MNDIETIHFVAFKNKKWEILKDVNLIDVLRQEKFDLLSLELKEIFSRYLIRLNIKSNSENNKLSF